MATAVVDMVLQYPNRCFVRFIDGEFKGRVGDYRLVCAGQSHVYEKGDVLVVHESLWATEPTLANHCGRLLVDAVNPAQPNPYQSIDRQRATAYGLLQTIRSLYHTVATPYSDADCIRMGWQDGIMTFDEYLVLRNVYLLEGAQPR